MNQKSSIARASAIRIARHETAMAQWPFGLVAARWLSKVSGLAHNTCKERAVRAPVRLDLWDATHWGDYPSTFGPWVSAWGIDRVLDFLDRHDAERAAYLRANVGGIHNAEADRAERRTKRKAEPVEARRERRNRAKTEPPSPKQRERSAKMSEFGLKRRAAALDGVPVGLVPLALCAVAAKVDRMTVRTYLIEQGLPMVSGIGWPKPVGSWSKLIAAWGVEKARAWVMQYAPEDIRTFERDVLGAARVDRPTDALDGQPVGLVPDTAFASMGFTPSTVESYRGRKGIAARYGRGRARFAAFVAEYGEVRAREWLAEHAPRLLTAFDSDMAAPVVNPATVKAEAKPAVKTVAKFVPFAKTEAEARRRPPAPTPKGEVAEPIRAQSVAEWLAAGGAVKRGPPMGWADPDSPNYDPEMVRMRRVEERRKWGRR